MRQSASKDIQISFKRIAVIFSCRMLATFKMQIFNAMALTLS